MDNGFIKLHRKLIEWEWFSDSNTFHVFMFLLLDANHADKKWKGVMVKRGEKITSVDKIRLRTGLSTQTVRTCLKRLESTREITIKTTNRYSIITICNYDTYQCRENSTNKQLTNDQQTANKQLTTNKNEKNEKKDTHGELKNVLLTEEEHEKLKAKFNGSCQEKIEKLSEYIASKGKKYSSHYATILSWSRRDAPAPTKEKVSKESKSEVDRLIAEGIL